MRLKLIAGIMVVLIFAGCGKKTEPIIRPVETKEAILIPEKLTYEYPAVVIAEKEAPLAFRVAGPIKTMNVEVGSYVKEGDIIAEMDKRDYEVQLEASKGKAAVAENAYRAAKAVAVNAREQFKRVETLYREKAVPKKTYDEALAGVKAATAAELANLAQYQAAQQGEINSRNQLEDTLLKAPYSGYISKKFLGTGAVAGAGIPVVAISSLGNSRARISVSEKEMDKMNNISEAVFIHNGKEYKLKLSDVGKVKGTVKLAYPVTFDIEGNTKNIPSDSNGIVKISFNTNDLDKGILIPAESLFEKKGDIKVWVYKDGQVSEKNVNVIKPYADGMVIVTGIKAGEKIVTKGVHELTEGQKVNLLEPFSETNVGDML